MKSKTGMFMSIAAAALAACASFGATGDGEGVVATQSFTAGRALKQAHIPRGEAEPRSGRYAGCKSAAINNERII